MSAMSVEMILRLIDQFTGPAKQAEVELERVKTAAEKLNQTRAGGSGGGAGGGRGPGGMRAAEWLEQQRALETHRKQLEAYEAQVKRVEEAQRAMVDSFLAAKLAHGSTDLVKDAFKAGTEGAHVEVSLAASGASPEEIKDIQERAAELSRQTGKTIPYRNLPEAEYAATLANFGLPEPMAKAYANFDSGAAHGALFEGGHELSRLIGRPTTPLSQSIAAALRG